MEGFLPDIIEGYSEYYSSGWKYGPPRGIMFHCGPVFNGNGTSSHFLIEKDGQVQQDVSLMNRSWHALEASDYYFSIFFYTRSEENPMVTDLQIENSIKICAEIVKFAKEKWSMTIPIIRAPGPGFSPGFKEHRDGLGSSWNPLLHKDGLVSSMPWQSYLDRIKNELQEDDMALFENKEDFRKETLKAFVGSDMEGQPLLEPEKILEAMMFLLGINLRMKGGERPSKIDAIQKGWDFSNHILALDLESGLLDLPEGKIVGKISFSQ